MIYSYTYICCSTLLFGDLVIQITWLMFRNSSSFTYLRAYLLTYLGPSILAERRPLTQNLRPTLSCALFCCCCLLLFILYSYILIPISCILWSTTFLFSLVIPSLCFLCDLVWWFPPQLEASLFSIRIVYSWLSLTGGFRVSL